MAKTENKRVSGISTASIAVFEGVFFGTLGLIVAILRALENTFQYAESSQSLLKGLTFGIASGVVLIVLLPIIWFAIGALVGAIHGVIYNYVSTQMGGITVRLTDDK